MYQLIFEDVLLETGKAIIAKAESILASLQNEHQCNLLRGTSAAQEILDYAKEYNCDLIVMGNRGLTGIREYLGSVSHAVVQRSLVSVAYREMITHSNCVTNQNC